jgi:hypothetical protein
MKLDPSRAKGELPSDQPIDSLVDDSSLFEVSIALGFNLPVSNQDIMASAPTKPFRKRATRIMPGNRILSQPLSGLYIRETSLSKKGDAPLEPAVRRRCVRTQLRTRTERWDVCLLNEKGSRRHTPIVIVRIGHSRQENLAQRGLTFHHFCPFSRTIQCREEQSDQD